MRTDLPWAEIRAVAFDFFRTLGMWRPGTIGSPAQVLYARSPHRLAIDPQRLVRLVEGESGTAQFPHRPTRREYLSWQYAAWHAAADYAGIRYDDDLERLLQQVLDERELMLYPDVVPALDALAASGRPWAVCSNASPDVAQKLAGLLPSAVAPAGIVISSDTGARKPHARMFDTVCEALGEVANGILFVGDDPQTDIFGPRQRGFLPLLLDREDRYRETWPSIGPDVPRWRCLKPMTAAFPREDGDGA